MVSSTVTHRMLIDQIDWFEAWTERVYSAEQQYGLCWLSYRVCACFTLKACRHYYTLFPLIEVCIARMEHLNMDEYCVFRIWAENGRSCGAILSTALIRNRCSSSYKIIHYLMTNSFLLTSLTHWPTLRWVVVVNSFFRRTVYLLSTRLLFWNNIISTICCAQLICPTTAPSNTPNSFGFNCAHWYVCEEKKHWV
jgi:hypothetical protein